MNTIFLVTSDGVINMVCDGEHFIISKEHPKYEEIMKVIMASKAIITKS